MFEQTFVDGVGKTNKGWTVMLSAAVQFAIIIVLIIIPLIFTDVLPPERGIGSDGRPILIANREPTEAGTLVCPGLGGGHNWEATAYSPQTGFYYFPSSDGCEIFLRNKQEFVEGRQYQAGPGTVAPTARRGGRARCALAG